MTPGRNTIQTPIRKIDAGVSGDAQDFVAVEEPLEIRLSFDAMGKREVRSLSVTMRTPGSDYELAAGFLLSEGIIRRENEIHQISYCVGADRNKQEYNVLSVSLRPGVVFDAARLARNFYTSSSCGVCGKASIDAVKAMLPARSDADPSPRVRSAHAGPLPQGEREQQPASRAPGSSFSVARQTICFLPKKLAEEQAVFEKTGGLHAAGLFDASGKLLGLKEDVGRHNAVDKVIGEQFLAGKTPLSTAILMVSGRASFEIMQKAVMAGIPVVAAVGAPSSLAVSVAQEFGMTLIGFLRGERFNIYSGAERIGM